MVKHSVAYTHNGVALSLKEEENPATCYHMDEPCARGKKPVTKGQILYDFTSVRYLEEPIQRQSRTVVARACGSREWGV